MFYVYDHMQLLYSPWNSLSQNIELGSLSLLQAIFPTQGSNPGLLHCRHSLPGEPQGKTSNFKLCNSIVTKLRSSGSLFKSQYLRGKC